MTPFTPEHFDFDTFLLAFGEKDARYEMYDLEVFAIAGGLRNLVHIAATPVRLSPCGNRFMQSLAPSLRATAPAIGVKTLAARH